MRKYDQEFFNDLTGAMKLTYDYICLPLISRDHISDMIGISLYNEGEFIDGPVNFGMDLDDNLTFLINIHEVYIEGKYSNGKWNYCMIDRINYRFPSELSQ